MAAVLDKAFFKEVEQLSSTDEKVLWYMTVIVYLGSTNYPDLIDPVWQHVSTTLFPQLSHDERFTIVTKLSESLVKSVGIVGAAKAGTAVRTLAGLIPEDLQDHSPSRRRTESAEMTKKRGLEYHSHIYSRNTEFDTTVASKANADYSYIIRELFYGRIFSFDEILNGLETGYVVVTALIAIDCRLQLRRQMKGMLYSGATPEDLTVLRDRCLGLAKRLNVVHRYDGVPIEIPSIE